MTVSVFAETQQAADHRTGECCSSALLGAWQQRRKPTAGSSNGGGSFFCLGGFLISLSAGLTEEYELLTTSLVLCLSRGALYGSERLCSLDLAKNSVDGLTATFSAWEDMAKGADKTGDRMTGCRSQSSLRLAVVHTASPISTVPARLHVCLLNHSTCAPRHGLAAARHWCLNGDCLIWQRTCQPGKFDCQTKRLMQTCAGSQWLRLLKSQATL